jgi:hypothetical protein
MFDRRRAVLTWLSANAAYPGTDVGLVGEGDQYTSTQGPQ